MTPGTPHHPQSPATPSADPFSGYRSALSGRYASREMQVVWSDRRRFEAWRRIWLALAESQRELGLPVTREQTEAIRARLAMTEEDFRRASEHERRLRHDVMAHVHALGDAAPEARGIVHLGATSQDINCNTEVPILREALDLVAVKTARVMDALGRFIEKWKATPCLGFTHYQPAQPTTVGKRAAVWATDLALCLERVEFTRDRLRLRGVKGATGTQASFLGLFEGDAERVDALERAVAERLGWDADAVLIATGQTYPRVVDAFVLSDIACLASVVQKIAGDIRLLSGMKELDEPFESDQVGSSAMPYKRNPMRCERATALARFAGSMAANAYATAGAQWLERTLDDSANRRLALPEAFLAMDGALDLLHNVCDGLIVHEGAVRRNLEQEMPFLATERLMLSAARAGADRQAVHEAIRKHAIEAARAVKESGKASDLLERLKKEALLKGVDFSEALRAEAHVGLAPEQAARTVAEVIEPVRARYAKRMAALASSAPAV